MSSLYIPYIIILITKSGFAKGKHQFLCLNIITIFHSTGYSFCGITFHYFWVQNTQLDKVPKLGSEVKVELPPNCFNSNFLGFALSVVTVPKSPAYHLCFLTRGNPMQLLPLRITLWPRDIILDKEEPQDKCTLIFPYHLLVGCIFLLVSFLLFLLNLIEFFCLYRCLQII